MIRARLRFVEESSQERSIFCPSKSLREGYVGAILTAGAAEWKIHSGCFHSDWLDWFCKETKSQFTPEDTEGIFALRQSISVDWCKAPEYPAWDSREYFEYINGIFDAMRRLDAASATPVINTIMEIHFYYLFCRALREDETRIRHKRKEGVALIKPFASPSTTLREDTNTKSRLGMIYLITARERGRFGCRGYVGQHEGLDLSRVRKHLGGSDSSTSFLIEEIYLKDCTPDFEILGQYPVRELNDREIQHYAALKEFGWSLCNRLKLV